MKAIGISPTYVKDWTIVKALKELIQNLLDTQEEFNCEGQINYIKEKGMAQIKDYGPGLEMKHFVMGVSEKGENSRGQFGEGLKLALLVFAREGRKVEVWTKGKRITPVIEYNEDFGQELINLDIEELPPHFKATHTGTSVKVECSQDELTRAKVYFLEYHKKIANFSWFTKDEISRTFDGNEKRGCVWINKTLVSAIKNGAFSYHFTGSEAQKIMNRDRDTIDHNELMEMVCHKWSRRATLPAVRALMEELKSADLGRTTTESPFWEYTLNLHHQYFPPEKRAIWKRAFTEVFGKDVVIATGTDADQRAEYHGFEVFDPRSWIWSSLLEQVGIPTANKFKDKVKMELIRQKDLDPKEKEGLKLARTLVDTHYRKVGTILISEGISLGTENSIDGSVNGAYCRKKDVIYLNRSILKDPLQATKTLLHEAVHKHSNARDGSIEFERALTNIAGELLFKLK